MPKKKGKEEQTLDEKLKIAIIPKEEEPYKVPDNWVWTTYENIFTDISSRRKTIKQKEYLEEGNIPVIDQGKNLIGGYTNDENEVFKEELPVLIFGDHTLNLKYIDFPFVVGADGVKVLKTTSIFNTKLLYYYIKSLGLKSLGYRRHYPILKLEKFLLIPEEEQKRIVNKLDYFFDKIQKVREIIEEVKEKNEARKESILSKAFTGELTAKWRADNIHSAKELLNKINDGKLVNWEQECQKAEAEGRKKPTKPKLKSTDEMIVPNDEIPYEIPNNWVWTRLGDIIKYTENFDIQKYKKPDELINYVDIESIDNSNYRIDKIKVKAVKELSSRARRVLKKGYILYSSVRPYLNNLALIEEERENFIGSTGFFVFKPIKVETKYVFNFFLTTYIKNHYLEFLKGFNSPSISNTIFENTFIPLPPIEEQKEIVRILDNIFTKENLINELISLEDKIQALEKSILDKAFRGELGTNSKDDIEAMELLKEILQK